MKPKFIRVNMLLTVSAMVSLSGGLSAQIVWNGAGDGTNWTDGANWVGGTAPANDITTDIAQWNGGIELDVNRSVHGLDFTGGAQLNDAGDDNTLTLGGGGIDVTGGGAGDIYTDVIFAADSIITLSNQRISFRGTSNLSGSGNVTITGGNIAYFDVGASTRTGGTTVTGGARASLKGSTGLGSGTVTLDNGTVEDNNVGYHWNNDVVVNAGGGTLNFNGNMNGTYTGNGALTIVGSSITSDKTITADGSGHSGGVTLDNVRFRTSNNSAYGTGAITLTNGAIIKNNNNNVTLENDIIIGDGGGGFEVGWSNRNIRLNGEVSGAGPLLVSNDSSFLRILSNNSYTGGTEIQGFVNTRSGGLGTGGIVLNDVAGGRGQLQNFEQEATLDNDMLVSANGGRLKAGWNSDLIITGVVSGSGQLTIEGDSGVNRLTNNANTFSGNIVLDAGTSRIAVGSLGGGTYSGVVSGEGTFEYTGSGIQTVTGTSSHTGSTTISTGTFFVDGDYSSSSFTIAGGAALGGSGDLGNVFFDDGALLDVFGGVLTLGSAATLSFADFGFDDLVNSAWMTDGEGTYTLIDGEFTLDSTGLQNFGAANALDRGDGYKVYFGEGSLVYSVVAIPEPGVSLLAGLGMFALIRRRRS
ncbi:PEP-CTERM sorting domain-containing protein [Roseibacillus persicicus]|uniref:PEP-CTERM sorting domain-containing protein n=1 Tax=Roseibacillus persicicus TaxID=454148 RepID=UPI00398B27C8